MATNSDEVKKKFLLSLNEFMQRQIGTIRTHKNRLKSTEGEETLKTEVKLTHLKKIYLKNRQIVQTPISHSTSKVFWKDSPRICPIFRSLYYFSVTKITTLIWLLTDKKKPKKREQILKKDSAPTQFKFSEL